jgi:hypothetical protein
MKRAILSCMPVLLVALFLGGCSPKGSSTETPASHDASGPAGPAAATGLAAMTPTTAGERAALELAKTDAGRKWANGNSDGSNGAATGDPMLVGYQVQLNDGKKIGYTLLVLNGQIYSPYGGPQPPKVADAINIWDYDKTNSFTWIEKPEGAEQEKAVQLAIDYVQANKQVTTTGGIEAYSIAFPKNENGQQPMVQAYANTETGTFSSGGTVNR